MDYANSILESQIEEAVKRLPYGLDPIMIQSRADKPVPYLSKDNRLAAKCHRGHPHLYHMSDIIARQVSCQTCSIDNAQFHRNLNSIEEIFQQPFTLSASLTVQHPKIPVVLAVGPADDARLEAGKLRITIKNKNTRSTKRYLITVLQTHLELFDENSRARIME